MHLARSATPATSARWVAVLAAVALVCAPLSSAGAAEPAAPRILGTVTSGGAPVSDVQVLVHDPEGGVVDSRWTDSRGRYELSVPPGAGYRLEFADPERQVYRTEFWEDEPSLASATVIAVGSADVSGKDAELVRNPQIRGTVTDENLDEIEGAVLDVFQLIGDTYQQVNRVSSGVDGRYRVPVESGVTYKVRVQHSGFRTQWLDDAATEDAATPLTQTATVTGKDVRMVRRAAVTGVVTGPSGPAAHADVIAYRHQSDFYWPEVARTQARADGSYSLGLEPGEYRIGFSASGLAPEYYSDSPTLKSSTPVVIDATGRSIDATLEELPTVRGTVTADADGSALGGIRVSALVRKDYADGPVWELTTSTVTKADGTYVLPLPAGTYKLSFDGSQAYRLEYHGDTTDADQAALVTVDANGAMVDASLMHHPTVSGVVTSPGGAPLADIQVGLVTQIAPGEWRTASTVRTAADGSYEVSDPPGTYLLRFRDDRRGVYRTEYLGDSPTRAGAETIELSEGADLVGRDAELIAQAAVTGTVRGPGGPAAGVVVTAYDTNGGTIDGDGEALSTVTSASGSYSLALEDSTYRLYFKPPTLSMRPEFWKDATSFDDAQLVVVDGSALSGVDADLAVGSGITGTVSVPGEQSRAYVMAYARGDDGSWTLFDEAEPQNGVFDLPLPPGTYRVKYTTDWLDPIYYGGSATFGGAADVVISEGEARALGDVAFGSSGAVTNAVPPSVTGNPEVGSMLTAAEGQWGPTPSAVALSRQWLRDGEPIEGATARTYSLEPADQGARIAVQVKGVQDGLLSRSKTSAPTAPVAVGQVVEPPAAELPAPAPQAPPIVTPPAVVKVNPTITISGKGGKKKATLTIAVKAAGVKPTGRITIKLGSRTLKTVMLKNGRAKVVLTRLKKGKKAYKVVYAGDTRVKPRTATSKKIAVR